MKTIETLGEEFIKKHRWLLQTIQSCEVAICGGCASAISKEKPDYIPEDLDLVATKGNALRLVDNINHFMLSHNVHYRIYVNSKNTFVPEPAIAHFRIQCAFWLPICLFVLPDDKFRYYRIKGGHLLQLPVDVKKAAGVMVEKDGKPRHAAEEDPFSDLDGFDDFLDENPDPDSFFDDPQTLAIYRHPLPESKKPGSGDLFPHHT
jgi:hypothetical protein